MTEQKHPQRCETIDLERVRDWLFDRAEMHQDRNEWDASFEDLYLVTAIFRGDFSCASHSSKLDAEQRPKFSSEDLILLAHDEWKRREERKHLHDEGCWIAGFLNGFCTSRRWAREQVDKIRRDAAEFQQEREGK